MIGKSRAGTGFGGLTRYLLHGEKDKLNPDRVLWTSTRELALDEPEQASLLMRMTAAQGRTKKPVHHLSISLAPGEHLSREQWENLVDTTLRDLQLEGHQVLIVAHQDTRHEHIHLMVNRVHPETGRAWNRWQDRPRLMASLRVQERVLGLRETPHVKNPDRIPDALVALYERTGELPFLDYARTAGRQIFQEARSWNELHERLTEKGLYLERKGQGLVVTDDHRHVKASSVDRAASLRALEARLGTYQERGPVLREVDSDLRGDRRSELTVQVAPVHEARHQVAVAIAERQDAARRLVNARDGIRSAIASAYREAPQVETRYFRFLNEEKAPPPVLPAQLGELRGTVLHAGRTYLPVGAEGKRAFEIADRDLPRYASAYLRAQDDLARADGRLAEARQKDEQLSQHLQPQLEELERIHTRAETLHERVLTLRPRDQIELARAHGKDVLERAASRSPEPATRTAELREKWMRSPSRQIDRALDRRLNRARVPAPARGQSPREWAALAFRAGMHPLHTIQALTRGGLPLADAANAVSLARSMVRNPARTSLLLTARAIGLPSVTVRLATIGWSIARGIVHVLTR